MAAITIPGHQTSSAHQKQIRLQSALLPHSSQNSFSHLRSRFGVCVCVLGRAYTTSHTQPLKSLPNPHTHLAVASTSSAHTRARTRSVVIWLGWMRARDADGERQWPIRRCGTLTPRHQVHTLYSSAKVEQLRASVRAHQNHLHSYEYTKKQESLG